MALELIELSWKCLSLAGLKVKSIIQIFYSINVLATVNELDGDNRVMVEKLGPKEKSFIDLKEKQQRRVSQTAFDAVKKVADDRNIDTINFAGYMLKRLVIIIVRIFIYCDILVTGPLIVQIGRLRKSEKEFRKGKILLRFGNLKKNIVCGFLLLEMILANLSGGKNFCLL